MTNPAATGVLVITWRANTRREPAGAQLETIPANAEFRVASSPPAATLIRRLAPNVKAVVLRVRQAHGTAREGEDRSGCCQQQWGG